MMLFSELYKLWLLFSSGDTALVTCVFSYLCLCSRTKASGIMFLVVVLDVDLVSLLLSGGGSVPCLVLP